MTLVFDGDCGFCRRWVSRWGRLTGQAVRYVPVQELRDDELPRPRAELAQAIHLILPDGRVLRGANAVFTALGEAPGHRWLSFAYRAIPGFAWVSEKFYGVVARHRMAFSKVTTALMGPKLEPPTYFRVREAILRGLGMIYFMAFGSFLPQVRGLIGEKGILPARDLLEAVSSGLGSSKYALLPTLSWINASDRSLLVQCALGAFCGVLLAMNVAPLITAGAAWLLFLSITVIGGDFLGFQWDALLLEAGFLALLLASRKRSPSIMIWLFRWLLFRLMFSSGLVKLLSGDESWRDLTALTFHYETQPLPTWMGWCAHQLPLFAQKASCAIMFAIELAAPFLIFAPRRLRLFGMSALVLLQALIMLTGNYAYFNWLTLVLCLSLLDDRAFPKIAHAESASAAFGRAGRRGIARVNGAIFGGILAILIALSGSGMLELAGARGFMPPALSRLEEWLRPFRLVNTYGLFAVMTRPRYEISIEGSNDLREWKEYEFKAKPGDPSKRPSYIAPDQPRLDWQMWFAALGTFRSTPWLQAFMARLLEGSAPVLGLLARNPFPDAPPRYLRSTFYEYHFTDRATRSATGRWWNRQLLGAYGPTISLGSGARR